jgi:hypothetical protein
MYAKIQKGNSQSYMLIHSDAQITINPRVTTSVDVLDYMIAQEQTQGKCGDDSQNANLSANVLHLLGVEDRTAFLIITEPNQVYLYGECEHGPRMENTSLAHVNVDGVSYLTEGNIYILNDKGQTIQKI